MPLSLKIIISAMYASAEDVCICSRRSSSTAIHSYFHQIELGGWCDNSWWWRVDRRHCVVATAADDAAAAAAVHLRRRVGVAVVLLDMIQDVHTQQNQKQNMQQWLDYVWNKVNRVRSKVYEWQYTAKGCEKGIIYFVNVCICQGQIF